MTVAASRACTGAHPRAGAVVRGQRRALAATARVYAGQRLGNDEDGLTDQPIIYWDVRPARHHLHHRRVVPNSEQVHLVCAVRREHVSVSSRQSANLGACATRDVRVRVAEASGGEQRLHLL